MEKVRGFIKEYREELFNKVDWPKYEDLQNNTITVIVASFLIAIVIATLDIVFNNMLKFVYQIIG